MDEWKREVEVTPILSTMAEQTNEWSRFRKDGVF